MKSFNQIFVFFQIVSFEKPGNIYPVNKAYLNFKIYFDPGWLLIFVFLASCVLCIYSRLFCRHFSIFKGMYCIQYNHIKQKINHISLHYEIGEMRYEIIINTSMHLENIWRSSRVHTHTLGMNRKGQRTMNKDLSPNQSRWKLLIDWFWELIAHTDDEKS